MATAGSTVFNSVAGPVRIAWQGRGISAVQFAEATPGSSSRGDPPPGFVADAIKKLRSYLAGEPSDLKRIPLFYEGITPFRRRIYEVARRVPSGTTASYGELAAQAGSPGAARAVGSAMANNPFMLLVPCHRVVASGGGVGGFSSPGGLSTKARLLALEGVRIRLPRRVSQLGDEHALTYDPLVAAQVLAKADPALGEWIEEFGPPRLTVRTLYGLFEGLAELVIDASPADPVAARARLETAFGDDHVPPPARLRAIPDERLRTSGLSRSTIRALRDLASHFMEGEVPSLSELRALTDDQARDRLTALRGVDPCTAELLLLVRLGRPDVLPVTDEGLQRGFGRVFLRGRTPTAKEVAKRGERWRPFRSVASWYLWQAAEVGA